VFSSSRGKGKQRIDVLPYVAAECDGVRRRTASAGTDVFAVLLYQAEYKRWMRGVVRHAREIGLAEVIYLHV
jgi:hypothetical protein